MSYFRRQLLSGLSSKHKAFVEKSYSLDPLVQREIFTKQLGEYLPKIDKTSFWSGNAPWQHQKDTIFNIYKQFSDPSKAPQAIVTLPAGSGKTEIFLNIVMSSIQKMSDNGSVISPTLIVVPTNTLVDQTYKRAQKQFPDLDIGIYNSDVKNIKPLTIITYASLMPMVEEGKIVPEDVTNIIMDEAHRGLSDRRWAIFNRFKGNTNIIASTASPVFDINKNVYALLGQDNEVINLPIKYFVDRGILAPINNYQVRVNIEYDMNEYPYADQQREIALYVSAAAAYEVLAENIRTDKKHAQPSLAFMSTIEDSQKVTQYFNERISLQTNNNDRTLADGYYDYEYFAETISSKNTTKQVDKIVEHLSNKNLAVAFNVGMFVEGNDIPAVSNILNISGTDSLVKSIQQSGRASRIDKTNPEKEANIYDFVVYMRDKNSVKPYVQYSSNKTYSEAIGTTDFMRDAFEVHVDLDKFLANLPNSDFENTLKNKQTSPSKNIRKYSKGRALKEKPFQYRSWEKLDDIPYAQKIKDPASGVEKELKISEPRIPMKKSPSAFIEPMSRGIKLKRYDNITYSKPVELIEQIRRKTESADDVRKKDKTDEWLTAEDFFQRLNLNKKSNAYLQFKSIFGFIESHYNNYFHEESNLTGTEFSIALDGKNIDIVCDDRFAAAQDEYVFCIHEDSFSFFAETLVQAQRLKQEWYGVNDFCFELGLPNQKGNCIEKLFVALQKEFVHATRKDTNIFTVTPPKCRNLSFDIRITGTKTDDFNNASKIKLKKSDLRKVRDYCAITETIFEQTEEFLKDSDIRHILYGHPEKIELYEMMVDEFFEQKKTPGAEVSLYGVRMKELIDSDWKKIITLNANDLTNLLKFVDGPKQETIKILNNEWMTINQVERRYAKRNDICIGIRLLKDSYFYDEKIMERAEQQVEFDSIFLEIEGERIEIIYRQDIEEIQKYLNEYDEQPLEVLNRMRNFEFLHAHVNTKSLPAIANAAKLRWEQNRQEFRSTLI